MKNSADATKTMKSKFCSVARLPRAAAECGMEEAYDLGYISGPRPDLPERAAKPESEQRSRTDIPACP